VTACNGILGIPEVELRAGDADTCVLGQKSCGGICVSALDPAVGCSAADCKPCALPHAKNTCVQGQCAIEACEEGFGNCNATRADGCEVDLRSAPRQCGPCPVDGAGVCVCTTNQSCKFGGTCDEGVCTCGDTACAPGAKCIEPGTCDY